MMLFEYSGGAYIDVTFEGDAAPHNAIGVYDHAAGAPRIQGRADFQARVDEYVRENSADDLRRRWEESR